MKVFGLGLRISSWEIIKFMRKIYLIEMLVLLSFVGCNRMSSVSKYAKFPDIVSPIYVVDQFDFPEPRLIDLGEEGIYILPASILDSIGNKEDLIGRDGVFRYFAPYDRVLGSYINRWYDIHICNPFKIDRQCPYSMINASYFDLEEVATQLETINGFPVYEFSLKPKSFALLLVSDPLKFSDGVNYEEVELSGDGVLMIGDVVDIWEYSKEYMPMVFPMFSKKEIKNYHRRRYQLE